MGRKHRGHKKAHRKIPVAIVAGAAPVASTAISCIMAPNRSLDQKGKDMAWLFAGYVDGEVRSERLFATYAPMAVGVAVDWAATRFGLNRKLNLPLIKI